jgi:SAM-dependent methyltransferase
MRFLARPLFSAGRFFARVSIVSNYVAVSTLDLAEVREGIRRSWEGFYARDEEIAAGLMEWEHDLTTRFVRPRDAVLLIGAGSGRDLIPLAEQQCRVTAVDPASAALEAARRALGRRQLDATLVEGFFEDVALSGTFDAVVFSFFSYSYIPQSRRRVEALRKAAALLAPGGHVVVSYPALPQPRPVLITLGRAAGAICRSDWRLEPGDLVTVQDGRVPGYAHAFHPEELDREVLAAGLRFAYRRDSPDPVAALVR